MQNQSCTYLLPRELGFDVELYVCQILKLFGFWQKFEHVKGMLSAAHVQTCGGVNNKNKLVFFSKKNCFGNQLELTNSGTSIITDIRYMKLEKYNNNDEIYCQVVNCSPKIVDVYNLTLHIEGV